MTSAKSWHNRLQLAVILLFGLPPATSLAMSESRTFFAAKIYEQRLELCTAAGTGCGKKAADTWCRRIGYKNAMSYRLVHNNQQHERARLVDFGELCAEDACSGFQSVKCRRDFQQ